MPAWTPAPYALPYIAPDDVIEQTPATNKAQMEKVSEYLAHVAGMTPIGTIIPWALPFEASGDPAYSNVPDLYLPCTGVVYPTSRAPELSAAIGHRFVDGEPDVGDVGDYVSGAALNKHHGSGYENNGIYRRTASGFDLVEAHGFCTPDFRGRSPIGQHSLNDAVVGYSTELGQRQGDWRTKAHSHAVIPNQYANSNAGGTLRNPGTPHEWNQYSGQPIVTQNTNSNGNSLAHGVRRTNITESQGTGPDDTNLTMVAYHHSVYIHEMFAAHGTSHFQPQTVVNFLIACGVSGSATPSTRSGEVHRLHAVTTDHMIRQRLADPNLSDEEREALEDYLASLS